jgi:hypothetical protein
MAPTEHRLVVAVVVVSEADRRRDDDGCMRQRGHPVFSVQPGSYIACRRPFGLAVLLVAFTI